MYVYEYKGKLYANFNTPKALLLLDIENFIRDLPTDDFFAKRLPTDTNSRMVETILSWDAENGTEENGKMRWEAWGNSITRKTVFQ